MFTLEGKESFATEITYGYDVDFVPPLILGVSKYPVKNHLTVELPAIIPFAAADDDRVAAFVGNDCRGTGVVGESFPVFRTTENETLQLRYYSAQKGGIYSMTQPVSLNKEEAKTITLNF